MIYYCVLEIANIINSCFFAYFIKIKKVKNTNNQHIRCGEEICRNITSIIVFA